MHYFTVNSEDNRHLGFLVLMADDEYDPAPTSGCLTLKAQAAPHEQQNCAAQWHVLSRLSAATLYWRRRGDGLHLSDAQGNAIGCLNQQHLQLYGQRFVLADLSGVL